MTDGVYVDYSDHINNVVLGGGDRADVLIAGSGDDTINGGTGDTLNGGVGDDIVNVSGNFSSVDGGADHDKLVIYGTDLINPVAGAITGIERIVITAGADLYLGRQMDAVGKIVTHSDDNGYTDATGTQSRDHIIGGAGMDALSGNAGDDRINGGGGSDIIYGDAGGDHVLGGTGADTFVYQSLGDFGIQGDFDRILDFSGTGGDSDKIDLTAIANFTFIGKAHFDGHGPELREIADTKGYIIIGDADGDGNADFRFHVTSASALTADDFVRSSSSTAAPSGAFVGAHLEPHPAFAPVHGIGHLALA